MYFLSFPLLVAPLHKCLNSTVSEHPSTVNMLKCAKRLWNLHESLLIKLRCQSELNLSKKALFYWYLNSCESLFKHWLPITSILFVIFGISRYYIKCNCMKNWKYFLDFSFHFWNIHEILNILKKKMTFIANVFPIF